MKPQGRMSDAQFDAIVCELRRLTLGGRPARPELEAAIPEPNRRNRRGRR